MDISLDNPQTKQTVKKILVELIQEEPNLFYQIIVETLEEIGLANAIREGHQNQYVPESEILNILNQHESTYLSLLPIIHPFKGETTCVITPLNF